MMVKTSRGSTMVKKVTMVKKTGGLPVVSNRGPVR